MTRNLLINSGVAINFQSATYQLTRNLYPGVVHTFSMSGWHGGNDWDSNFGVYGVTDSGSEVLLAEAPYSSLVGFYYVRFTPNASYSYITVKSMKTHNNFNYQIDWAVLNEGMTIYSVHIEPVLLDVRRLYYGQNEVMKRYVGSDLTHLVEWQRETRMEIIPFSTSRYNDANRYIGEEVITQQGVNGWMEYVWTAEVVNGVRTGNRTSELVGQFQAPRQQQIAVGTRVREVIISGRPQNKLTTSFTRQFTIVELSEALILNANYTIETSGSTPYYAIILYDSPGHPSHGNVWSMAPFYSSNFTATTTMQGRKYIGVEGYNHSLVVKKVG